MRNLALDQAVLGSPGFATATPSLTSHDALVGFLATLAGASRRLRLSSLGRSQQGRDLPAVVRAVIDEMLKLGRERQRVFGAVEQGVGARLGEVVV